MGRAAEQSFRRSAVDMLATHGLPSNALQLQSRLVKLKTYS